MEDIKIYLEFDRVLEQALAENHFSIADIIKGRKINAKVSYGVAPYIKEKGSQTKDVIPIILASSIAIGSIGFAISQVLNAIYNKPYLVEYDELVELRDREGNLVFDKEGQPIFKNTKYQKILIADNKDLSTKFEAKFDVLNGLIIRFSSEKGKK